MNGCYLSQHTALLSHCPGEAAEDTAVKPPAMALDGQFSASVLYQGTISCTSEHVQLKCQQPCSGWEWITQAANILCSVCRTCQHGLTRTSAFPSSDGRNGGCHHWLGRRLPNSEAAQKALHLWRVVWHFPTCPFLHYQCKCNKNFRHKYL